MRSCGESIFGNDLLGYQILNGEMVEGFQICEQEICRYVSGYAQFYEKNDSMLAYMLENRGKRQNRRRWIRKNTKW